MILHDDSLIREYTDHGLLVRPDAAGPVRRGALGPPGPRRDAGFPDRAELLATEPRTLTRVRPEGGGAGDVATGARLRKDEVVVVRLPNTWELVALYLAVWRAGGIISPLPMQWREHELSYVSRLTDARTYIAPPSFKGFDHHEMARALGGRHAAAGADLAERAVVDGGRLTRCRPAPGRGTGDERRREAVLDFGHRSRAEGLPGVPQQLAVPGRLHPAGGCAAGRRPATGDGADREHDRCRACLVAWLQSAGILVLHRPVNMPLLLRQLTGHDVQFTLLAPTLLNMISKLPEADEIDLSSARTIVTGSAPPSAWIPEEFQRRGASRSPTCGARTRAPDWPRALRMYPS